jgi:3-oxoacyl-[acyl-carrier protein] reductase
MEILEEILGNRKGGGKGEKPSGWYMDAGLRDRVALVTGASGGIGADIARAFVAEGASVVAHYRTGADRARALAEELGPRCLPVGADLTREADVDRLFEESERRLGPVDVLVANAGCWPAEYVPLEQMSLERWNHTLMTDLTSVFLCLRAFCRGVARHRLVDPSAVLVGSTAGIFGEAGHADYATAKAGFTFGLVRSVKNELARLAPRGRVNVVCPGWTLTPMTEEFANDPASITRALQTMPLRKVARTSDVAMAVLYLASSRLAGHVTGQILTIAGGMEGRLLYQAEEIDPQRA